MIVGFTGSSEGMSDDQIKELWHWLGIYADVENEFEFHHGDCVGADAEAHDIAKLRRYKTIAHPPTIENKRAFKAADIILEAKKYLDRNQDIAEVCDVLIAAPLTDKEVLRSGTWSTIRKAKKLNKEVIMLKR